MQLEKLTDYGQIKEGDLIIISAKFAKNPFACNAIVVLDGGSNKEEIIYNQGKNHYCITSMVLDGSSQVNEIYIVK